MSEPPTDFETLARDVRIYAFREAAASARVPQALQIMGGCTAPCA